MKIRRTFFSVKLTKNFEKEIWKSQNKGMVQRTAILIIFIHVQIFFAIFLKKDKNRKLKSSYN